MSRKYVVEPATLNMVMTMMIVVEERGGSNEKEIILSLIHHGDSESRSISSSGIEGSMNMSIQVSQ